MDNEQEERQEIEAYLNQHHLQAFLGDTVNEVVKERPKDPLVRLADALRACSDSSRQIQGVKGRQVLSGEALPALEVEICTCQGLFYGAVSSGPYDEHDEQYEGKGVLTATDSVGNILAEIVDGKDPTAQTMIDKMLTSESSLPANVVSAASIACCKAGAKQTLIPVYDHLAAISNNSECAIPAPAFSIINGGRLSASSLWVQDILVVPRRDGANFAQRIEVASKVHRTLEEVARQAGQETLQRGPRGGFCNGAGTFEQLMDCLVTALEAAGCIGNAEVIVDVHASKLVASEDGEEVAINQEPTVTYDLVTFKADKTGVDLTTTADGLLDTYLEWLEKYPITGFVEPFATTDIAHAKDLLNRGNQLLRGKSGSSAGERSETIPRANELPSDGNAPLADAPGEGASNGEDDNVLLKVIADESVLTPAQLVFVNEQRGANAILLNLAKISTVSECNTLAGKAAEVGWATLVGASSEDELEAEFLTDLAIGLGAETLLIGGLRAAGAITACAHMGRIESTGLQFAGAAQQ